MKILLTGATGQVGGELARLLASLGEVAAPERAALDLASPDSIVAAVRALRPALIVNPGAYTAVDRAESEPELAQAVNAGAPRVLAEEAKRLGATLVHYSTDYIFDGAKPSAYTEEDAPNPLGVYGRSKLEGEQAVRSSGCRSLVLRTSWVYAPRGRNFFIAIAQKARSGGPLRVVADQHGVPSAADYIARATHALLGRGAEGVYNVVPSGRTTWHGFATEIVARLGLGVPVAPIATHEYPVKATRPVNSVLDCEKLARLLGAPEPWQAGLERCIGRWTP